MSRRSSYYLKGEIAGLVEAIRLLSGPGFRNQRRALNKKILPLQAQIDKIEYQRMEAFTRHQKRFRGW